MGECSVLNVKYMQQSSPRDNYGRGFRMSVRARSVELQRKSFPDTIGQLQI